ncbi:HU family DNA-binding protein [Desertivirga xinjiangensis]|uniref:HU family DNA-binding protein n=1 Tax=Desertivirga xinjiangensis TaxID=539206 RepID=UPI00210CC367|nr:HU family DNA-binding protein [Pedobacter xinjiangensis]
MTKAEIIAEISGKTGIEKLDVQEAVEAFFKVVKNSMVQGENVYVRGFGSFVVKKRATKTARNISKNTAIIIPEHFVPSFKPAKVFVEKVKNGNVTKLAAAAAEAAASAEA